MGLMDRLRAMFGGSKEETPKVEEVDEELAAERAQHDVERERDHAASSYELPNSFDDRR